MHRPMLFAQRPPWPLRLLKGISFFVTEYRPMQLFENPMAPKCRKCVVGVSEVVVVMLCCFACPNCLCSFCYENVTESALGAWRATRHSHPTRHGLILFAAVAFDRHIILQPRHKANNKPRLLLFLRM